MAPLELCFSIFLLFFLQPLAKAQTCSSVNCGEAIVDFPFRLPGQPDCCGNPNFNQLISCRNRSRFLERDAIITFPFAGEFNVLTIGLSKGTAYGLIFGLGTPAFLLLLVFMTYYNSRRNYGDNQHHQHPNVEVSRSVEPQAAAATAANGLDRSRIEAYPITLLEKQREACIIFRLIA
ncbi:hypothetical protein CCACVL1_13448 [Corchorus capsularis]|uniref:RING-type E3 ubiquitin transferase n=1 Tax=Corchorus capsularis TaxID=210143 RepID=A0A1R3IAY7_COCAP|nr:hypothetical protein CCACVL1_13448 [Corchorus capsularis]